MAFDPLPKAISRRAPVPGRAAPAMVVSIVKSDPLCLIQASTDAGGAGAAVQDVVTYPEPDPSRVIAVLPPAPGMPVTPSVGEPT